MMLQPSNSNTLYSQRRMAMASNPVAIQSPLAKKVRSPHMGQSDPAVGADDKALTPPKDMGEFAQYLKDEMTPYDNSLQKKYRGQYAHLAPPLPFSQVTANVVGSAGAINSWRQGVPAKDSQLSNLSATGTMAGSGLIAVLATLGLNHHRIKSPVQFLPEFLGVASWFTAMAVTPKIIYSLVNAKTGLNLQQQYISSYDDHKYLYNDFDYIPPNLISDKTSKRVGRKEHIDPDAPDHQKQVADRVRQISVQANTWWMMVAGPAAAVLSGLTCDFLNKPVLRGANEIRKNMTNAPAKSLACLVGNRPEADLSMWWKGLSSDIIQVTVLKDRKANSYQAKIEGMIDHLAGLSVNRPKLANVQTFLKMKQAKLSKISQECDSILNNRQGGLTPAQKEKLETKTRGRLQSAQSTLNHYVALFNLIEKAEKPTEELRHSVRQRMESNLSTLQFLRREGHWNRAVELCGGEANFKRVVAALDERKSAQASMLLGAAPLEHMARSLESKTMHRRWKSRMSMGLGGLLFASTLAFTSMFVGRKFTVSETAAGSAPDKNAPKPQPAPPASAPPDDAQKAPSQAPAPMPSTPQTAQQPTSPSSAPPQMPQATPKTAAPAEATASQPVDNQQQVSDPALQKKQGGAA